MLDSLKILSPKRSSSLQTSWDGFFPYYAGYPESFARTLLSSAKLPSGAVVLDPWNGSGTTTYAASLLGLTGRGFDLNPVMVIVARARLLPPSEADSIEPFATSILGHKSKRKLITSSDPLHVWFTPETAASIRHVERNIRKRLVGKMTLTPSGTKLDKISGFAATFYVALFSVCRELSSSFKSSNPTWLRRPREHEDKISVPDHEIHERVLSKLQGMAAVLAARAEQHDLLVYEQGKADVRLADSTSDKFESRSADFILSSPPYCTRIDYTAATRIELAILTPLMSLPEKDLGRKMIGSTQVPRHKIRLGKSWGQTCIDFLGKVRTHESKASKTYYYSTHLDYFHKMSRSLANVSRALKLGGSAVLVVQDSYYKDVYNDLPTMICEMCARNGLRLMRREDFPLVRSLARINPRALKYEATRHAAETVLCFEKIQPSRERPWQPNQT